MISEEEARYGSLPIINAHIQEAPSRVRVVKPRIDLKKCEKSYNCVVFCPTGAIKPDAKGMPTIDYNLCNGCLICLRECPTFAISEEQENRAVKI